LEKSQKIRENPEKLEKTWKNPKKIRENPKKL
jgi:hypothetical protein